MQLTSIQPAISNGGGAVTRSAAPPGTASGSVPQPRTSSSSTSPSSSTSVSSATPSSPTVPSRPASPSSRGDGGSGGIQVSISEQARQQGPREEARGAPQPGEDASQPQPERPRRGPERQDGDSGRQQPERGEEGPSPEQQAAVQELRGRDQEVRQHEQAHQVVGGQYAGAPTYTYQRGPDGQLYAVGGQVSIDTSPIADDPEATISKMQTVRAAALAPAEPSPQDIRVAQEATRQLLQAQSELRSSSQDSSQQKDGSGDGRVQDAPATEASASERAGGDDARLSLFRDVEDMPSTDAATATDTGFRATA